ncbi:hypothetical protein BDB00DRAFT_820642 [Zychaea mexicana]|uniref:uncharacterized protein n=1 Tax=Zychaea mexicana TaxID=64656 RepID=UPI0022FE4106|nr:uncharacterized protein BDB00DRAFT_820642 [Zychaea mexicana]KAI9494040.1 hypothetical protein BDB00DRAFT_820642 [Zychaea mexicana]
MPVTVPFLTGNKQLSIELAEPVVYLRGPPSNPATHVLRGEIVLVLSKPISASSVVVKITGKSHMLWPEGIGSRGTKMFHEKTVHEQNIILESWDHQENHYDKTINAGLHRWPFEFLLPNRLTETIEDDLAKVFYYVSVTVHRPGLSVPNLKSRREILLLRTMTTYDSALASHNLPTTSINVERQLEYCEAHVCVETAIVSSGTQFPITLTLTPHTKNDVSLESFNVIASEQRIYRLPEYGARRAEMFDFKLKLSSVSNTNDPSLRHVVKEVPPAQLKRALTTKNAHIPLPFSYRFVLKLPNCVDGMNHSTFFNEIELRHCLKISIELSVPDQPERSIINLELPFTILDCRLKEDYAVLPTYEEALTGEPATDDSTPAGFFACPCYLDYKKKRRCIRQDWMMFRQQSAASANDDSSPPPPPYYEK